MNALRFMIAAALATTTFAASPRPVPAQVAFGEHYVFDTRFGRVSILGGEVDQILTFNGQDVDDVYGVTFLVHGAIGLGDQPHDWVLVSGQTGGNGCFPVFFLMRVGADGVVASPPFGHCLARPLDMRVAPGQVEVDLSNPDRTVARSTFVFDGMSLTSATERFEITDQPAGAGADVTRWLGRHPQETLQDFSERARFETIMPPGEIDALSAHVNVSGGTFQVGDWVIGQGCLAHQCDVSRGVWGLRISDGAVGAAILGPNGYADLYGHAGSDPVLRQVIDAHRP